MRLVSVKVLSFKDLLQQHHVYLSGAGLSFHLHSSRHASRVWERDVNSRPLVVKSSSWDMGGLPASPALCCSRV